MVGAGLEESVYTGSKTNIMASHGRQLAWSRSLRLREDSPIGTACQKLEHIVVGRRTGPGNSIFVRSPNSQSCTNVYWVCRPKNDGLHPRKALGFVQPGFPRRFTTPCILPPIGELEMAPASSPRATAPAQDDHARRHQAVTRA